MPIYTRVDFINGEKIELLYSLKLSSTLIKLVSKIINKNKKVEWSSKLKYIWKEKKTEER